MNILEFELSDGTFLRWFMSDTEAADMEHRLKDMLGEPIYAIDRD